MTGGRTPPPLEGYETANQASARLGVTRKHIVHMAYKGQIPGAVQANGGYWYVPAGCEPLYKPPEGYQLTAAAAQRLGCSQRRLSDMLYQGRIEGAYRVQVGKQLLWLVPVDAHRPDRLERARWREGAFARPMRYAPRCDCCGILLAHSGDDRHANDGPEATRCWSCREDYGLGPVSAEVLGEYAEELEEVMA